MERRDRPTRTPVVDWRRSDQRWVATEARRGEQGDLSGTSFAVDELFSVLDAMRPAQGERAKQ